MLILIIRTLILYGTVITSMRIMGKRQIGELQPSELVVAIMISDLAAVPMQEINIPLLSGIIPVLTLIVAEVLMSYLSLKSHSIRKLITGEPSIVIYNGHINEGELSKLRFNISDLIEELRVNNCSNISDVEVAVLETSGKLSVILKDDKRPVTVSDMGIKNPHREGMPFSLVVDGKIDKAELSRSGKDEAWLDKTLKKRGILNIKKVFLASLDAGGELFVQAKGEADEG